MINLITKEEFGTYRVISNRAEDGKFDELIKQGMGDLRDKIGENFFYDVLKNKENPSYEELLNGGEYNKGEFTVEHEGLKSLLADLAYSRYLYASNVDHTPFGIVGKKSQDSEAVDRAVIKDLVKQNNQDADRKWQFIKSYLNENKEVFTVWTKEQNEGDNNSNPGFKGNRITFL